MSNEDPIKTFVQAVLTQAQKADATEVAIAPAEGESTPIRYKVSGKWYDMAPPPSRVRPVVVAELALLANLSEGPFPKGGVIEIVTDNVSSKWELSAPTAEGEWMLTRSAE